MYSLEFSKLIKRYPDLSVCESQVLGAIKVIHECFQAGNKIISFGNGGSSCDAEHFCGEMQKSFIKDRPLTSKEKEQLMAVDPNLAKNLEGGLPAISLGVMHGAHSAIANDLGHEFGFAQQIWALGKSGDIAIGFSTSGNSINVVNALKSAKAKGLRTICFTGIKHSDCSKVAEISLQAPSSITHEAQEFHIAIYHAICMEIENLLF